MSWSNPLEGMTHPEEVELLMANVGVSCLRCGCQVLWRSYDEAAREAFAGDFVAAHAVCEGEQW